MELASAIAIAGKAIDAGLLDNAQLLLITFLKLPGLLLGGTGIGVQIVDLLLTVGNDLHNGLKQEFLRHKEDGEGIEQNEQRSPGIDTQK